MYSLLLALIYLAFISLGLPDSLLGAGWPAMHAALGVPLSYMGAVSVIISACTVLSSLMSGRITRRLGTARVTVVSVFLTAAALFGFSVSHRFWLLTVFAVPYGLGAGAIDAALNNYVALHYTSRHMSWLHCFWGVGTVISPYIMSAMLGSAGWNCGYRAVSLIQLGIGIILLLTLPVWKINERRNSRQVPEGGAAGVFDALKIRGVPFVLIGFFGYCSAEATAMLWSGSYLAEVRGVSAEAAASFAALFYIGLTVGRFLSGFVADRLGDRRMIFIGAAVAAVGVVCAALPVSGVLLSLAGFVLAGFGCAPIYPCIIHATPAVFGAENSAALIGVQMAGAYVGSACAPPLFGILSRLTGLELLPAYLAFFIVVMTLMLSKTFRLAAE